MTMKRIMNVVHLIVFVGLFSTLAVEQVCGSTIPLVNQTTENQNENDRSSKAHDEDALRMEHQNECICTPFNLCKTYKPAADGNELIDIRINLSPCKSYFDICCNDTFINPTDEHISSSTDISIDPILPNDMNNNNNNNGCMCAPNEEDFNNEQNNKDSTTVFNKMIDSTNPIITSESTVSHIITSESTEIRITTESTESTVNHIYTSESTETHSTSEEPIDNQTNDQDDHKCGIWNKRGVGFRIKNAIDGESQYGEYPSMMVIFKEEVSKDGERKLFYHCGGSLIGKNVVLTAAHCVIKKDPSKIIVRAGEWDLKTEKEVLPHQDRRVSKIVTHPEYYSGALYNDVALIFTEEPFNMQENIKIMCLPHEDDIFTDAYCYSSGWGKTVSYNNYTIIKKTESGSTSEIGHYEVSIMKNVELPIISREKCMEALRTTRLGPKFELHKSFICAGGEKGKDTCKGDGGSPLMCPSKDDPNHLVQAGIVAWGIQCGIDGIPAAYVNVAGFRNWIDKEIKNYQEMSSK